MTEYVETIIVGAGQGGLSTSFYLKQHGRKHIILEREHQVATAWRKRWDTFTLVTPNWMTNLPGAEYHGDEPDGFMARDNVVAYFEEYVRQFELPITYGIRVTSVEPIKKGYLVRSGEAQLEAANVVVATGLFQQPKIPAISSGLSSAINQIHSSEYRNPASLPSGAVLVVGSGQSGCQIAEELYQNGRKVYLSLSSAGRLPRRYRGKDVTHWFDDIGFTAMTVDKLQSPAAKFAASAHATGKAGGHTINLHQFAKDGVVLLGHVKSANQNQIVLAPDMKESLAKADKVEANLIKQVDEYIEKSGLDAPIEILPELRDGFEQEELLELNLLSSGITSVIWATGYKFDFGLVNLPAFDHDGYPLQTRGVTSFPGLYFVGLPWLHNIKSGLLAGVGQDAAHVARHIDSRIPL